ncbi:MAG: AAA family ATPase [Leptolyngbyaceae cyanobacterium MO_188.B28]|nr:AAA family ATPase [Leptolyngbyaceae cyanobacterium MO_188.B28]
MKDSSSDPRITLPGYLILQKIYENSRTLIYRAQKTSDQTPVVIKLAKAERPTLTELAHFRNQYAVAKNLDLPSIVRPLALHHSPNGFALVLEDFGGLSLREYLERGGRGERRGEGEKEPPNATLQSPIAVSIAQFLAIAVQLAKILEGLYEYRVIHKDINPSNILIHPQTQQIKLTDFSLASLLPQEVQALRSPFGLEGTLAYLSPEQTGRMNRTIDYRTDFYSLGVTFYELLTGRLPFAATDPMELVHCHILQKPAPLSQINSTVPEVVSDIVMKLMAKAAEDRYQSPQGLRCDLERCLSEYSEHGGIDTFWLGGQDNADRFQISEKLYGRDREIVALRSAFDRVADVNPQRKKSVSSAANSIRREMVLAIGFSGVGKTALVNQAYKPIAQQQSYFITGKFEPLQPNAPLSGLIQAVQDLIIQLLSESEAQLNQWKHKILDALGDNGQVIIDIIPELEQVIGPQSPVPELAGKAAQNRFNLLFQRFIQLFANQDHPLVIFLDDLQWADFASLRLIQWVMTEAEIDRLLLVGAYREHEVFPSHPLMQMLDQIRQNQSTTVNTLTLEPLSQVDTTAWTADNLSCSAEVARPLAELMYQKTLGNPFFIAQFLRILHNHGLIAFDRNAGHWQWDVAEVKELAQTQDVIALMTRQMGKLPEKTLDALQVAACLGDRFDLSTLAQICGRSEAKISIDLWPALQTGLISPNSDLYKFYLAPSSNQSGRLNPDVQISYQFSHAQIRQLAYAFIAEEPKQRKHLGIGRRLQSNTPEETWGNKIFGIVNQLNYGAELISDQTQQNELAHLNLIAGEKSNALTAYRRSLDYFKTGIGYLGSDCWENSYDLTLALYQAATEAAYLSGELDEVEELAEIVLQETKILLDQVKIYELKAQAYTAQNHLQEAVENSLSFAKQLGAKLPQDPSKLTILLSLAKTKSSLFLKNPSKLISLKPMTNATALATMRVLLTVGLSAYEAVPQLAQLIVFKLVGLSVQYGNAPQSPYGYAAYGFILCGELGEIETGYKFGQLALKLLEQTPAKEIEAKTLYLVAHSIQHWKTHIRETLQPLLKGCQLGLETGDFEFAALHAQSHACYSYFAGEELGAIAQQMADYSETIRQFEQPAALALHRVYWQTVLNLLNPVQPTPQNPDPDPCFLMGDAYDEQAMLPLHQQANQRNAIYHLHFNKLVLCYLFRQPQQALLNAEIARKYLDSVIGLFAVPLFYFYDSLARLAIIAEMRHDSTHRQPQALQNLLTRVNVKQMLDRVSSNQKKMRTWAEYAPMNHLHRVDLVEAEKYRVLGRLSKAVDLYDRAIKGAKKNRFIQDEALAKELTGRFYLEWGKDKIAQTYLTEAYDAYARWGAKAKVEDLESRYPELLLTVLHQSVDPQPLSAPQSASGASNGQALDASVDAAQGLNLTPVVQISQALSGELSPEDLLTRLMKIILENSGAEKGSLILSRNGQLFLEASASAGSDQVVVGQAILLDVLATSKTMSSLLPTSIIHAVSRALEPLVLEHAAETDAFAADPYMSFWRPLSVLCQPVLGQGKLIGVVYLENNSTTDAFTPDQVKLVELLSSQAAIALENARLYDSIKEYSQTLEAKVEQRTEALQQQNQILQQQVRDRRQPTIAQPQSDPKFFAAFHASPEPITILDLKEKRFIDVNDSFCRLSGYSQETLMGSTVPELKLWRDPLEQPNFLETVKNKGRIRNHELNFHTQSGELKTVLLSADSLKLENRPCSIVVINDITEQKQAETTLKSAKESAEAANRAKGEFLAQMSHELRTPLNAILGFNQMLKQDSSLNPDYQQYLGIIDHSSEHLLALIDDILTMSKIEADCIPLNSKQFDLPRLLKNLQAQLQIQAQSKDLQLTFDITPNIPRRVTTDQGKLRQVLINLLNNAIQFTETGRVTLRVMKAEGEPEIGDRGKNSQKSEARSQKSEGSPLNTRPSQNPKSKIQNPKSFPLLFEIQDTGPGIPPDAIDTLFEPFGQTKDGRRPQSGVGLGLAISRRFANLMGGEITVESVAGQGTTFRLLLPVKRDGSVKPQTAQSIKPARNVIGLASDQPNYRILVVEDNRINRLLMVQMLSSVGFEVREAFNGQEAIEVWKSWAPHLIWMDIQMPVMDGYEATKRIKVMASKQSNGKVEKERNGKVASHAALDAQPSARPVVIALTAAVFEQEQFLILASGCDDFVSKPLKREHIFAKMAEYLDVKYVYQE